MQVIIGVDPHKASHTAVAIDGGEEELARTKVRSSRRQVEQLLAWAVTFEKRRWAVESAGGLGYLLAQQLVAAGEDVVDVPATLASRIRVLGSGRSHKNDPNDALSVAVAALRASALRSVVSAHDAEVMRFGQAQCRHRQRADTGGVPPARSAGRALSWRGGQGNQRF